MSEYPKVIERPYKVYTGYQNEVMYVTGPTEKTYVDWRYDRSFRLESDAEAYAERISEDYEFVKIEKKE